MNQMEFQRELMSFDEKIALAELEESKASERVKELRYQKARFSLDIFMQNAKEQEAAAQQQTQEPKPEGQ
jgi:hypothetical protein